MKKKHKKAIVKREMEKKTCKVGHNWIKKSGVRSRQLTESIVGSKEAEEDGIY